MAYQHIYDALIEELESRYPSFEIIYKDESLVHKTLGVLAFWMWKKDEDTGKLKSGYMEDYISVLGYKTAYPSREWEDARRSPPWKILAHEGTHMFDRNRLKVIFDFIYACPQILLLLAVLAFLSPWFLLLLLFGLPVPSPGRAWAEIRGYTMSMACNQWAHGSIRDETLDWIVEQFVGPYYYFMWPFKGHVRKIFEKQRKRCESGEILEDEWFATVKEIVDENLHK